VPLLSGPDQRRGRVEHGGEVGGVRGLPAVVSERCVAQGRSEQ
jgi:hypothetical protein